MGSGMAMTSGVCMNGSASPTIGSWPSSARRWLRIAPQVEAAGDQITGRGPSACLVPAVGQGVGRGARGLGLGPDEGAGPPSSWAASEPLNSLASSVIRSLLRRHGQVDHGAVAGVARSRRSPSLVSAESSPPPLHAAASRATATSATRPRPVWPVGGRRRARPVVDRALVMGWALVGCGRWGSAPSTEAGRAVGEVCRVGAVGRGRLGRHQPNSSPAARTAGRGRGARRSAREARPSRPRPVLPPRSGRRPGLAVLDRAGAGRPDRREHDPEGRHRFELLDDESLILALSGLCRQGRGPVVVTRALKRPT